MKIENLRVIAQKSVGALGGVALLAACGSGAQPPEKASCDAPAETATFHDGRADLIAYNPNTHHAALLEVKRAFGIVNALYFNQGDPEAHSLGLPRWADTQPSYDFPLVDAHWTAQIGADAVTVEGAC